MPQRQQQTKQVPLSAMNFASEFKFGDNGENAKSAPVEIFAISTEPKNHFWWGQCVHDMEGMQHKERIPIDYCHDDKEVIGYANKFIVSDEGITVKGALTPYKGDDRASEIIHKAGQGVPYEASINFAAGLVIEEVEPGMSVEVNGTTFEGPGVVFRKWTLRGVAICPYGVDANTAAEFAANKNNDNTIEVETMTTKKMIEKTKQFSEENETKKEETTTEPEATENAEGVEVEEPETEAESGNETGTAPEGGESQSVEGNGSNSEFSAQAKPFIDAFGKEKGAVYFCQGKTMEQATMLFAQEIQAENTTLKKENQELKDKLEFAKKNAGADLTEQSASDADKIDPEYTKLFKQCGEDKAKTDKIWNRRQALKSKKASKQ